MPRLTNYVDEVQCVVNHFPSVGVFETRSVEFWNALEVNSERVLSDSQDMDFLAQVLSSLGKGGLQALCLWLGLDPQQIRGTLAQDLANYFGTNLTSTGCQSVILIIDFLQRKRSDAIETISRLLLSEAKFDLIQSSSVDPNSKRFFYAALVFIENPHHLQLLMLFERAERAGYKRYVLTPTMEIAGQSLDEQTAELARQNIQRGVDLPELSVGRINDILETFEAQHNQQVSLCLDLFPDNLNEVTLVFILRYLRESHIRQVEDTIFAQEAELIVLRLHDSMRTVEEHSKSGIGVRIAARIATELLEDTNIRYIEDAQLTERGHVEELMNALITPSDDRLRFHELYLQTAPIDEAPILILRCEKTRSLAAPLEFLRQRSLDLLQDLNNIRNLNIAFVMGLGTNREKVYIFKVYCKWANQGRFFLPYSVANIPTNVRSTFEQYLWDNYHVRVVPGTE